MVFQLLVVLLLILVVVVIICVLVKRHSNARLVEVAATNKGGTGGTEIKAKGQMKRSSSL